MSKKHYVAIAAVFAAADKHKANWSGATMRREIMSGIASVMSADNPRFDVQRFLAACGMGA